MHSIQDYLWVAPGPPGGCSELTNILEPVLSSIIFWTFQLILFSYSKTPQIFSQSLFCESETAKFSMPPLHLNPRGKTIKEKMQLSLGVKEITIQYLCKIDWKNKQVLFRNGINFEFGVGPHLSTYWAAVSLSFF